MRAVRDTETGPPLPYQPAVAIGGPTGFQARRQLPPLPRENLPRSKDHYAPAILCRDTESALRKPTAVQSASAVQTRMSRGQLAGETSHSTSARIRDQSTLRSRAVPIHR